MTIDTLETVLAWAIGALLFLAAALTIIRITVGPTVLDRVVASDVLVSIVVCALGAHVALSGLSTTLPLLVSLSLVGFLGAVAVARFVAQDEDPGPDAAPDARAERDAQAAHRDARRPRPGQVERGGRS
ncbi:monovalent cation/H+ antiporter complex subunit F [Ornithinimicrobium panacihumi]|uniref:monovalent cation/H+ antiporter complex subunit F n=1 Tax=Ornithinimicrobium panacihumi TaxID=2008449 RepID=UPI003F8AD776